MNASIGLSNNIIILNIMDHWTDIGMGQIVGVKSFGFNTPNFYYKTWK